MTIRQHTERPRLLWVTDLHYPSRGRRYYEEDLWLSGRLRRHFRVALVHPLDARPWLARADGVLFRNAGPVLGYRDEYDAFRREVKMRRLPIYNPLGGKADMRGKGYLVELSREGWPVIPTVDRREDLERLPEAEEYVAKPILGADSRGIERLAPVDLEVFEFGEEDDAPDEEDADGVRIVQPLVDFEYEVSFYFLDGELHYALHAPDADERWKLETYEPSAEDVAFARRFVEWNDLERGIQRVDAVRRKDGELLLMELEDVNPYLSLDLLPEATRKRFVEALVASLNEMLGA